MPLNLKKAVLLNLEEAVMIHHFFTSDLTAPLYLYGEGKGGD